MAVETRFDINGEAWKWDEFRTLADLHAAVVESLIASGMTDTPELRRWAWMELAMVLGGQLRMDPRELKPEMEIAGLL